MTSRLIVLRPEPGASATAKRAERAGWSATVLPLFEITPVEWTPPAPGDFDAVLMTSANAARFGGAGLARYHHLPLYAVGAQTADAARDHGFGTMISGEAGVAEMADRLRSDDAARIFHPAGKNARPFDENGLTVIRVPVYAANPVTPPNLKPEIGDTAVLLVHSPRAARRLNALCAAQDIARDTLALVAISAATLAEAGPGWRASVAADYPTDDAMLATAASLTSEP